MIHNILMICCMKVFEINKKNNDEHMQRIEIIDVFLIVIVSTFFWSKHLKFLVLTKLKEGEKRIIYRRRNTQEK